MMSILILGATLVSGMESGSATHIVQGISQVNFFSMGFFGKDETIGYFYLIKRNHLRWAPP